MQAQELTELIIPQTQEWMRCPNTDINYPGLAYFCSLDQLIVAARKEPLHDVIGNYDVTYTIYNTEGQKVFLAVQESTFRRFNIKVFNIYGNEVIHLKERFKFCFNKASFWAPPGNFLGSVEEELSRLTCVKKIVVKNALRKAVLVIQRRQTPFQSDYDVLSDGEKVGILTNRWRFTNILNVTSYGISFPIFMSVEYKVMMLCACVFIGRLKY